MALKIGDVRDAIRLNTNWLIATVLGLDALTSAEKKELEDAGRLPKHSIDLVEKSFTLGRLKSILTSAEYGKVDYAELIKRISTMETTPLEKKTIEQVKRRAATNFKSFTNRIENFIFKEIQIADNKTLADAAIRNALDTEELSVLEDKAYNELVSSLEQAIKELYEQGWHLAVETELHAAKTQGIAQAILNGLDIYTGSGGPSARVSVVPKPTACLDCKGQYLDASGNPKIFMLSDLIANGTNVDSIHSKKKGVHTFWRPTLPPLHPRCRCELQYVPPGAVWLNGKLSMPLTKAIGDSALSPTQKPQGAPANQKDPTLSNPPASPGLRSPLQKPGAGATGRPSTPKPATGGGDKNMVPCPLGGGEACQAAGGPVGGAETHEAGGAVMREHMAYQAKHQQGSSDMAGSMAKTDKQYSESQKVANPHLKTLHTLSKGIITSSSPLGENEKGVTEAFKVTFDDGTEAIVKPPAYSDSPLVAEGLAMASGAHTSPFGTAHTREKAFYQGAVMFGLTDHVPPTEVRSFEGKPVSAQQWANDFSPATSTLISSGLNANMAKALLENAPPDKVSQVRNKLHETIVLSAVFNHNDHHNNNLLVSKDLTDIKLIDNSASFGTGLEGYCSQLFKQMHSAGYKVTIPDALMHRFKNTTFSDIQRGIGDTVEDWAAGQTFIRMKYLAYLQETEGHLDYDKFRGATYGNTTGTAVSPHPGYWDDIQYQRTPKGGFVTDIYGARIPVKTKLGEFVSPEYTRRKLSGTTSNQMFESFAKQWIEDAKNLPEGHPDRVSAEALDKIGIFMGMGFAENQSRYRAEGRHREYEKTIKPGYPPKDVKAVLATISDTELAATIKPEVASTVKPTKAKRDLESTIKPKKKTDVKTLVMDAAADKVLGKEAATKKPTKLFDVSLLEKSMSKLRGYY